MGTGVRSKIDSWRSSKAAGASPATHFTEKNGVKIYDDTDEGAKAFRKITSHYVHLTKKAYITTGPETGTIAKKKDMFAILEKKGMNDFIVSMEKGQEKRNLKLLQDHGYFVAAKRSSDAANVNPWDEIQYYVSRKKMKRLGLDFNIETYYKRGPED